MMAPPILKEPEPGTGYRATARHFQWLAEAFASPKLKNGPRLSAAKMKATLESFEKAPPTELAAIKAVVTAITSELDRA